MVNSLHDKSNVISCCGLIISIGHHYTSCWLNFCKNYSHHNVYLIDFSNGYYLMNIVIPWAMQFKIRCQSWKRCQICSLLEIIQNQNNFSCEYLRYTNFIFKYIQSGTQEIMFDFENISHTCGKHKRIIKIFKLRSCNTC